jgi:hypothetical protein
MKTLLQLKAVERHAIHRCAMIAQICKREARTADSRVWALRSADHERVLESVCEVTEGRSDA